MDGRCFWCGKSNNVLYKLVAKEIIHADDKNYWLDKIRNSEITVCEKCLVDSYIAIERLDSSFFHRITRIVRWFINTYMLKIVYKLMKYLAVFIVLPLVILDIILRVTNMKVYLNIIKELGGILFLFVELLLSSLAAPLLLSAMLVSILAIYLRNSIVLALKLKYKRIPKSFSVIIIILSLFLFVSMGITAASLLIIILLPYATSLEETYIVISINLFPPILEVTLEPIPIVLCRIEYYHAIVGFVLFGIYKIINNSYKGKVRENLMRKLNLREIYEAL